MIIEGKVTSTVESGVATITFSHPQSNSLPGTLLRSLASTITELGNNSEARVIVIQSEGEKTFCAGASFDELISLTTLEEGRVFFSGFALVINAIRKAPKFVIARIQGKAVGGGVGVAAAADYAIAHNSSEVKLSELAVGIGPFVVGPAVERKIGKSAFGTLSINATAWHSAQWALEKGLFAEVHDSLHAVDQSIAKLASRLSGSSPEAMKQLKAVLWEGTSHWDTLLPERAEMSGTLVLSQHAKNAIEGFKKGAR